MSRIFPTVIKRTTTTIISGAVNWLGRVRSATRLTWVGALIAKVRSALRITFSPSSLRMDERPATRITTFGVASLVKALARAGTRVTTQWSGTLKPTERPATRMSFQAPMILKTQERPATNLVQAKIDLAHASYIVTASQDAGGTGTWANPTRAQGAPNDPGDHSGDSDIGGNALLLITGTLRGTMVAQTNRPSTLTITRVDLDWYGQVSGLPIVDDLVSRLVLGYRINTSPIPAADRDEITIATGNSNFHSAQGPRTARIDNGAGLFTDTLGTPVTWANIALIQPYFKCAIILGLTGAHYYADACRLRVTATETVAL